MKSKHLLFTFLIALIFFGCKGKEEIPTYYVDKDMLRYCWFPEGSYWIYKLDGPTVMVDTVYVSNRVKIIKEGDFGDYLYEGIGFDLEVEGQIRRQAINAIPLDGNGEFILSELIESFSDGSVQQNDYLLFNSPKGSDTLGIYPNPYKTNLDSIEIEGVTYYDAIEVSVNPPQAADWTYDVVWVKDVGIVRRSIIDGTTWNLIRYHIND